MENVISDIF